MYSTHCYRKLPKVKTPITRYDIRMLTEPLGVFSEESKLWNRYCSGPLSLTCSHIGLVTIVLGKTKRLTLVLEWNDVRGNIIQFSDNEYFAVGSNSELSCESRWIFSHRKRDLLMKFLLFKTNWIRHLHGYRFNLQVGKHRIKPWYVYIAPCWQRKMHLTSIFLTK